MGDLKNIYHTLLNTWIYIDKSSSSISLLQSVSAISRLRHSVLFAYTQLTSFYTSCVAVGVQVTLTSIHAHTTRVQTFTTLMPMFTRNPPFYQSTFQPIHQSTAFRSS